MGDDYDFNYQDEVEKACKKFEMGDDLNLLEQILVDHNGHPVETKYPDMKNYVKYFTFVEMIKRWMK